MADIQSDDANNDWYPVKSVLFGSEQRHILLQRFNGSIISLANILLLRGDIELPARERKRLSFTTLTTLLVDFILSRAQQSSGSSDTEELSSLLNIIPSTRQGLEVDVGFESCTSFGQDPSKGELALFRKAGVSLVHGWLPDSQDQQTWDALAVRAGTYDQAVARLAMADELLDGALLGGDSTERNNTIEPPETSPWTAEQEQLVEDGATIQSFLKDSSSQLTYAGLFALPSQIPSKSLAALYRNNHLSTITNHDGRLFSLVTDSAFLHEQKIVWQSLDDVDEANATLYDANFERAHPAQDWVQQRQRSLSYGDSMGRISGDQQDLDYALQLQTEEYNTQHRAVPYISSVQQNTPLPDSLQPKPPAPQTSRKEKDKKCLIS